MENKDEKSISYMGVKFSKLLVRLNSNIFLLHINAYVCVIKIDYQFNDAF